MRPARRHAQVSTVAWMALGVSAAHLWAQAPDPNAAAPATSPAQPAVLAVVPLDSKIPGSAAMVTGALRVANGQAFVSGNGTVTAGSGTTDVALPGRGSLAICAATTVKLAADTSAPAGQMPGLMMGLDHGAIEASFETGHNADTVLTPDFRILIAGPGAAHVKIRLGQGGDTCIDNPASGAADAPYVLVTSVFDGSLYRVQPGQRVMLEHGSTSEVVDQEKEPCGCPPAQPEGNDFPLAQSEGLAPLPAPPPNPVQKSAAPQVAQVQPLVYDAGQQPPTESAATPESAGAGTAQAAAPANPPQPEKKPGFFARLGRFFKKIFGAE